MSTWGRTCVCVFVCVSCRLREFPSVYFCLFPSVCFLLFVSFSAILEFREAVEAPSYIRLCLLCIGLPFPLSFRPKLLRVFARREEGKNSHQGGQEGKKKVGPLDVSK